MTFPPGQNISDDMYLVIFYGFEPDPLCPMVGILRVAPDVAKQGSGFYIFLWKRRRWNLLTTTFLPADGKAGGRTTCRGRGGGGGEIEEQEEEEEEKEEEDYN